MRILHVTECYEGGVSRALDTIARLAPDHEHFLLWEGLADPVPTGLFEETFKLPKSVLARISSVNRVAVRTDADIIHAHSSWAGVYARALKPVVPVVYEPHCFAFDDPDRSSLSRAAYRLAESVLSRRTNSIIALTPHEEALAQGLTTRAEILRLPNVPTIDVELKAETNFADFEVVMVGRLVRQKDPEFFANVASLVHSVSAATRFTWIGDGDTTYRGILERAGVTVTGWVEKKELEDRLRKASIYLHSAKYEGFPLSVLDAAAADLPIIVRDLPCFEGYELLKVETAEVAAMNVIELVNNHGRYTALHTNSRKLLEHMNDDSQTIALAQIYDRLRVLA
ncbi:MULTISPECIES: glycosyltransferase [unclassified Pseudarthrobacter]|uniref:glycosyltransferase n=1 Tax=unclassified Pseudarthrobacter TaxID=2647000 RepID=UPI00307838AE